ncbi:amidohydrolase family protein [Paractinoplanes durhamensis]|uniref:N-ethylammeline chlorohydrolase n=1 Tax=Paractinoplanes durhamensis TaxID=113563 RepID=A0ABQ3YVE5_9ACTN|nr:amidohydrolase family protein [Actinoplanes durhamensis]GIE01565.1 N-ethylammeline chlorohydrolase [Actinoplanes durhamensis]
MTRLITAPLAFVGDEWIADAAIAVDGDTIVAAGPASAIAVDHDGAEVWTDRAIVPGGVNGHGHTFQALIRGFGDDLRFADWMGRLVHPTAAGLDRDAIALAARYDFAEMLRMGITTAVEFFYLHDGGNDNALAIIEAAREVGLRAVLARCMFDADPGPPRYRESPALFEKNFRDLRTAVAGDPLIDIHPAPHSVLGAGPVMLELGAALGAEFDVPVHVHLADSQGEVDTSITRFGVTPIGRMAALGVLDERTLAVHAVRVDNGDLALLAEHGSTVVHNPSANAFLGGGIAPVRRMLDRGIPVCLGTDAGGANSRQSLFEEMRMAALLAKALDRDGTALTATDALRMGTSAGGRALRLPVGLIAPGYRADLVGLDLTAPSLRPRRTATQNVVYSMLPEAVERVVVGGRTVVRDGRLLTVDVQEIGAKVDALTAAWTPLSGTHPTDTVLS